MEGKLSVIGIKDQPLTIEKKERVVTWRLNNIERQQKLITSF